MWKSEDKLVSEEYKEDKYKKCKNFIKCEIVHLERSSVLTLDSRHTGSNDKTFLNLDILKPTTEI